MLYQQHENGTVPDKGSYSKSYLLSPLYKPYKFVIGISEHPVLPVVFYGSESSERGKD